ncbi:MAG TPA: MarC family protein [Candidatus Binatia bacterium]
MRESSRSCGLIMSQELTLFVSIFATMYVTYLFFAYAKIVLSRIGPRGIDAATRIVGFFVSTIGMGLIFHGVIEAFQTYGVLSRPPA